MSKSRLYLGLAAVVLAMLVAFIAPMPSKAMVGFPRKRAPLDNELMEKQQAEHSELAEVINPFPPFPPPIRNLKA